MITHILLSCKACVFGRRSLRTMDFSEICIWIICFLFFFEPEKFESIAKSFFLRIRWCFFYYWSTVDLKCVFISGVQQCVIQLYLLIYLYIFKLFPQIKKKFFFKFFFRVYWSEKGTYVIFSETSDMFYILNIKHPENKYR